MRYLILIVASLMLASCTEEKDENLDPPKEEQAVNNDRPKYTYKVFQTPDVGWGYQIFRGPKLIIDQKHVPAVPGVKGFATKEQAELAVQFILQKVEAGNERPPVSPEELDSIGAIDLGQFLPPPPPPPEIAPPPPPPIDVEEEEVREEEYEEM